jgi:hypothetical protein
MVLGPDGVGGGVPAPLAITAALGERAAALLA